MTDRQGVIPVIKDFYKNVVSRKSYWMPVLFLTLLAYGFSLSRNTLSVDDINMEYYFGNKAVMLAAGRWGMVLWMRLIGIFNYSPFIYKFFGLFFMIMASILLSCLFYVIRSHKQKDIYPYTLLSLVFLTYPLINEIWEYNGANTMLAGNLMIVFATIIYLLYSKHHVLLRIVLSGLILTIVTSSYESGVFVYITTICCLIFYKYGVANQKKHIFKEWFSFGARFIPSLVISIILRIVIGCLIISIRGLKYSPVGDVSIGWLSEDKSTYFGAILNLIKDHIFRGLYNFLYYPITLFLVAIVFFIAFCIYLSIKKHRLTIMLLGIILFLSVFLLSFVKLSPMPYRTAQTFGLFVAFVVFLASNSIVFSKRCLRIGIIVLLSCVSIYQSVFLSQLFYYNNLRSDNELAIVRELGMKIYSLDTKKPVIVCGYYYYGDDILEKISVGDDNDVKKAYIKLIQNLTRYDDISSRKCIDTNINSIINWSIYENFNLGSLFSYCGFDLDINTDLSLLDIQQKTDFAENKHMKPYEVADMGDYYLVYLGPKVEINTK